MSLKALVHVVVMIDGQRVGFEPGTELPDILHPHDVAELLAMKSIEDTDDVAREKRIDANLEKIALRDFERAREGVIARDESVLVSVDPASGTDGTAVVVGAIGDAGKVEVIATAAIAPVLSVAQVDSVVSNADQKIEVATTATETPPATKPTSAKAKKTPVEK